jgi:hypothetical protein
VTMFLNGTSGFFGDNSGLRYARRHDLNSFDEMAGRFREALQHNLRFAPGEGDFYNENRARLARFMTASSAHTDSILDFGGGIGLAIPHLRGQFPHSRLYIYDSSKESVARATQENDLLTALILEDLCSQKFDMILLQE